MLRYLVRRIRTFGMPCGERTRLGSNISAIMPVLIDKDASEYLQKPFGYRPGHPMPAWLHWCRRIESEADRRPCSMTILQRHASHSRAEHNREIPASVPRNLKARFCALARHALPGPAGQG